MAFDNVNNYNTTQAKSEQTIPLIYDESLRRSLYEAETLRPLGDDRSALLSGSGDTFQTYKRSKFSVSTITEGQAIPVSKTTYDKIEVTIDWYGDAKQIPLQSYVSVFPFVLQDWNLDAVSALGENRDNVIMAELVTGASEVIYPVGETPVTEDNIAVGDVISYEQILIGRTKFRKNLHNADNLIVSPEDYSVLLKDPRFIGAEYIDGRPVMNGLVGGILSMNVFETTAVTYSEEGSQEGVLVANNIMMENNAFIYVQKYAPVFAFAEIPGVRNLGYEYAYYESFGCKTQTPEALMVIKSAVGLVEES